MLECSSGKLRADLFQEVHRDTSVPDASHLVWRHETLPIAAQPVSCIGLVILHDTMHAQHLVWRYETLPAAAQPISCIGLVILHDTAYAQHLVRGHGALLNLVHLACKPAWHGAYSTSGQGT